MVLIAPYLITDTTNCICHAFILCPMHHDFLTSSSFVCDDVASCNNHVFASAFSSSANTSQNRIERIVVRLPHLLSWSTHIESENEADNSFYRHPHSEDIFPFLLIRRFAKPADTSTPILFSQIRRFDTRHCSTRCRSFRVKRKHHQLMDPHQGRKLSSQFRTKSNHPSDYFGRIQAPRRRRTTSHGLRSLLFANLSCL